MCAILISVKQLGVLLICMMVTLGSFAQDAGESPDAGSFGVVIFAEGNSVSVIRDQRRTEYDAFTGEMLGLALYAGDIIQTDPATYVEIQLLPSRSVVKVAENTSFTIEQVGSSGDGVFNLAYGRLRARVNRLGGQDPFEIRGVGATAGVRGTDFGTDVVVQPIGGSSLTRIYCFEGEVQVDVASAPGEPPSESEPVIVTANQMVTATTLSPTAAATRAGQTATADPDPVAEVAAITPAISEFWQRKNFVAEAKDADAVLAEFPYLRADATERLGSVAFMQAATAAPAVAVEEVAVSEPEPVVEAVVADAELQEPAAEPGVLRAADAISLESDGDVQDAMAPDGLIRATRAVGISMIALGVVADAAAVTSYFLGDQILPGWAPATDLDILTVVAGGGAVLLITGIFSLVSSFQADR
jgi:FecR-like protein